MHAEIRHPCVQHKLGHLRDKNTPSTVFRELTTELTLLLGYEALKDLRLKTREVETPLCTTQVNAIGQAVVLVPILRAGVGMLDGMLRLAPQARVGFLGLFRDPETHLPVHYYEKLPQHLEDPFVVILDPMLATGGSTVAAIDQVKAMGYPNIRVLCIIASPEGLAHVADKHPDVLVITGSIDQGLNERDYIVPGLGDAGDRIFRTS